MASTTKRKIVIKINNNNENETKKDQQDAEKYSTPKNKFERNFSIFDKDNFQNERLPTNNSYDFKSHKITLNNENEKNSNDLINSKLVIKGTKSHMKSLSSNEPRPLNNNLIENSRKTKFLQAKRHTKKDSFKKLSIDNLKENLKTDNLYLKKGKSILKKDKKDSNFQSNKHIELNLLAEFHDVNVAPTIHKSKSTTTKSLKQESYSPSHSSYIDEQSEFSYSQYNSDDYENITDRLLMIYDYDNTDLQAFVNYKKQCFITRKSYIFTYILMYLVIISIVKFLFR